MMSWNDKSCQYIPPKPVYSISKFLTLFNWIWFTLLTWITYADMICTVAFSISTAILPVWSWTSGNFTKRSTPASKFITPTLVFQACSVSVALYITSTTCETRITNTVSTVHWHLGSICAKVFTRRTHPAGNTICTLGRIVGSVANACESKTKNVLNYHLMCASRKVQVVNIRETAFCQSVSLLML